MYLYVGCFGLFIGLTGGYWSFSFWDGLTKVGLLPQLFFALKQRKVTKENSSQTRFAPRVLTACAHPHPILLLEYKEKEQSR